MIFDGTTTNSPRLFNQGKKHLTLKVSLSFKVSWSKDIKHSSCPRTKDGTFYIKNVFVIIQHTATSICVRDQNNIIRSLLISKMSAVHIGIKRIPF